MISALLLRWIVTALFVLSAAEMVYALVKSHRTWTHVVSHLLHLVMAVAMAVMAWPRGAALPTIASMVFFLLATVWFVGVVVAGLGHRLVNGYHATMMLAMAWMYAVMNRNLLPGVGTGHVVYVDVLNWACTIGFTVTTLWWLYRYFVQPKAEPAQASHRFLGDASQAMMAAGMAIMFGVML
ncbi:MAG: DUF5134 domain-containing protein [Mycobacterium sp.]